MLRNLDVGRKRRVGKTGVELTEIGFGGAGLGNLFNEIENREALDIIDAAWEVGVRYFDTAPYYGFGLSERRLGDALRARPRKEYVLSTKVGRLLDPMPALADPSREREGFKAALPFNARYDYTYDGVMRSFEHSLQRTGLASIDLLLVHDIGAFTHRDAHEAMWAQLFSGGYRALDELRSAKLIGGVGLGVNEVDVCLDAMRLGRFDLLLVAGRYTLLEQPALDKLFPACALHGASLVLGGIYNSGILATGTRSSALGRHDYNVPDNETFARVRRIESACDKFEVSLASAALQFALAPSIVAAVVPGLTTARQARDIPNLRDARIPQEFWAELQATGLLSHNVPLPTTEKL